MMLTMIYDDVAADDGKADNCDVKDNDDDGDDDDDNVNDDDHVDDICWSPI